MTTIGPVRTPRLACGQRVHQRRIVSTSVAASLDRVEAAGQDGIDTFGVTEIAGDADGRLARDRVRVVQQALDAPAHVGMAERIQRADGGLAHGRVGVGEERQQRVEGLRVADPSERGGGGDGDDPLARHQGRERRDGAAIAETPERGNRGEPDLGVFRAQLFDQQVDDARVLPDDGFDDVGADRRLAEEAGQRLVHGGSAHPAQHPHQRLEPIGRCRRDRVEQTLRAGGLEGGLEFGRDVGAAAVARFVALVQAGQRARHGQRAPGRIEDVDQRADHLGAAELGQGIDRRLADVVARQHRDQADGDAAVADLRQGVDGGEGQEEVAGFGDVGERLDRVGRAEPAEGLDRMEAHVRVGIAQRRDQRGRRPPAVAARPAPAPPASAGRHRAPRAARSAAP